jgi:hypothetical protein
MKRALVGAGLLLVLGCAGCSSTPSSTASTAVKTTIPATTTSGTMSVAQAGANYLGAIGPTNAAAVKFVTAVHGWTSNTSNAQAEADAQPYISASKALDTVLTNDQWPANATADIHTLIGGDAAIEGDLASLSSFDLLNSSSWRATFNRDVATVSSAVGLVRHDLGLPPAQS